MDTTVKYDPSLVQSLFIYVVETGLQQESIRAKLRPLLEKPSVSDEELMDKVNLAVSAEAERQNKMGVVSKKSAIVNQIHNNTVPAQESQRVNAEKKSGKQEKDQCKPNKLVVQADLASLKEAFNKSQMKAEEVSNGNDQRNPAKRNSGLCKICKESGEQKCFHCYRCMRVNRTFCKRMQKAPGKRQTATPGGQGVANRNYFSHICAYCKRKRDNYTF